MHRLTRGVTRRLEALETLLRHREAPETPEQTVRRLELVKAALNGTYPDDLLEEERVLFEKIVRYAPVFMELVHEGTLDGYLDGDYEGR